MKLWQTNKLNQILRVRPHQKKG